MQLSPFSTRLAEALTSRLCHELISPVGAVANGVEILREDPAFAADATAIIGLSVRQASRRLQYYRFAYGSTSEPGEEASRAATTSFFEESKMTCDWREGLAPLPPGWTKLVLNLIVLASECIPRGGRISVVPSDGPMPVMVSAEGRAAKIPEEAAELMSPDLPPDRIVPRSVHIVFTAALAHRLGCQPEIVILSPDRVEILLRPI